LLNWVREEIRNVLVKAEKDDVLAMVIHGLITRGLGWEPREVRFGEDEHELKYSKQGSPLGELEIRLVRRGNKLVMELRGGARLGPISGFLHDLVREVLGVDLDHVGERLVLDLDHYVGDDLSPRNVEELDQVLRKVVEELERRASERAHS